MLTLLFLLFGGRNLAAMEEFHSAVGRAWVACFVRVDPVAVSDVSVMYFCKELPEVALLLQSIRGFVGVG